MMAGLLWYRSYMGSLANTSGYYPDIHAGHADRVTELTLRVPYLIREVPSGYNQLELSQIIGGTMIVGGSLQSVEATAHVTNGKNLLPALKDGTYSGNGVTAVVTNGVATLSGTSTTSGNALIIPLAEEVTVPTEQCYLHLLNSDVMVSAAPSFELSTDVGNTSMSLAFSPANRIVAVNQNRLGVKWDRVRFYLASGITISGTFSPMLMMTNTAAEYSEYHASTTYPLASITLRGISTTVDGVLSYDGDTYDPDGTVTRYYGERAYQAGDESLPDAVTDGTNTVYKLTTPVTESAAPYTATQTVEEGGTVQFVTSNNIPVGNVSIYRRV